MKLWGGRFETGPSEVFERFSNSLHFDRRLLDADVAGSQAFARSLTRAGVLTEDECACLVGAFDSIREDAAAPAFFDGATDEDVHTFVIRKLKERVGGVADKIHTGRSRNEQVSLDIRLWLRAECDRCRELLRGTDERAARSGGAVSEGCDSRLYASAARAAGAVAALSAGIFRNVRAGSRAVSARRGARANVLPLGSGALAGSGFPHDREAIARDLGFDAVTRNSMDVSADRDFALDYLYAASVTMIHLSRLAEDWILYSSEEFGWIELGDGVTSGSSLMPQKKNPDSLELIRGKCGRVLGALNSLMITMKGLPLTYNRDMQEDKEPLFDAADQTGGVSKWRARSRRR